MTKNVKDLNKMEQLNKEMEKLIKSSIEEKEKSLLNYKLLDDVNIKDKKLKRTYDSVYRFNRISDMSRKLIINNPDFLGITGLYPNGIDRNLLKSNLEEIRLISEINTIIELIFIPLRTSLIRDLTVLKGDLSIIAPMSTKKTVFLISELIEEVSNKEIIKPLRKLERIIDEFESNLIGSLMTDNNKTFDYWKGCKNKDISELVLAYKEYVTVPHNYMKNKTREETFSEFILNGNCLEVKKVKLLDLGVLINILAECKLYDIEIDNKKYSKNLSTFEKDIAYLHKKREISTGNKELSYQIPLLTVPTVIENILNFILKEESTLNDKTKLENKDSDAIELLNNDNKIQEMLDQLFSFAYSPLIRCHLSQHTVTYVFSVHNRYKNIKGYRANIDLVSDNLKQEIRTSSNPTIKALEEIIKEIKNTKIEINESLFTPKLDVFVNQYNNNNTEYIPRVIGNEEPLKLALVNKYDMKLVYKTDIVSLRGKICDEFSDMIPFMYFYTINEFNLQDTKISDNIKASIYKFGAYFRRMDTNMNYNDGNNSLLTISFLNLSDKCEKMETMDELLEKKVELKTNISVIINPIQSYKKEILEYTVVTENEASNVIKQFNSRGNYYSNHNVVNNLIFSMITNICRGKTTQMSDNRILTNILNKPDDLYFKGLNRLI